MTPALSSATAPVGAVVPTLFPAIEVRELSHCYGTRTALDSLSLKIHTGGVFALLGPNGSGKSTLFRILATLQRPSSGTASVLGMDVVLDAHRVREAIGVAFQSPSLDKKLTVRENLRYQGLLYGLHGLELSNRIEEVLAAVHLRDRMGERVEKLSGGLMRRVEIAKCLMHRPKVLLLDEPSVGLDPGSRRQLRDQLEELRKSRGVTSILTTHLMEEADTCDRVAILDNGKLVVEGAPEQLKRTVGGDVIHCWTDQPAQLAVEIRERMRTEAIELADRVRLEHEDGFEFAARIAAAFPQRVSRINVGRPTLEDVFLRYTGHSLESGDGQGESARS